MPFKVAFGIFCWLTRYNLYVVSTFLIYDYYFLYHVFSCFIVSPMYKLHIICTNYTYVCKLHILCTSFTSRCCRMDHPWVEFISSSSGLAPDRSRFLLCMLSAFPLALLFSTLLHPKRASPTLRHGFQLVVGLAFCFFCFKLLVFILYCIDIAM